MPAEDSRFTAADVLRFTAPTEGALAPPRRDAAFSASRNGRRQTTAAARRTPTARRAAWAGYLCPLSANRYGIRFNSFKVRDVDSNAALFEVRAPPASDDEQIIVDDLTPEQEVQIRSIRYQFPSTVLSLKRIGTT